MAGDPACGAGWPERLTCCGRIEAWDPSRGCLEQTSVAGREFPVDRANRKIQVLDCTRRQSLPDSGRLGRPWTAAVWTTLVLALGFDIAVLSGFPKLFPWAVGTVQALASALLVGVSVLAFRDKPEARAPEVRVAETSTAPREDRAAKALQRIFGTTVEVVIGVGIVTATLGLISLGGGFSPTGVLSPLQALLTRPYQVVIYVIYMVTTIQFLLGDQLHFGLRTEETHPELPSTNFSFLFIEALTLFGMGASVAANALVPFFAWFLTLLIVDFLWIVLVVVPYHDGKDHWTGATIRAALPKSLSLRWTCSCDRGAACEKMEAYGFWLSTDLLFMAFLLPVAPALTFPSLAKEWSEVIHLGSIALLLVVLLAAVANSRYISPFLGAKL